MERPSVFYMMEIYETRVEMRKYLLLHGLHTNFLFFSLKYSSRGTAFGIPIGGVLLKDCS